MESKTRAVQDDKKAAKGLKRVCLTREESEPLYAAKGMATT